MVTMLRAYTRVYGKNYLQKIRNSESNPIFVKYDTNNLQRFETARSRVQTANFCTKDSKSPSEETVEIYHGNISRYVRSIKLFSLTTSAMGLLAQPVLISKALENHSIGYILGLSSIAIFSIASPLLLHLVTKRYVTHIYFDAKENIYTVKIYSLFLAEKKIEFTVEDVIVPDMSGLFTSCYIKGIPIFLDQLSFKDKSHYIKLMKYDQPMDFKLNVIQDKSERSVQDTERKSEDKT